VDKQSKVNLSKLNIDSVDAVVDVHMKAFPGFFLTFLGKRFLYEFYKSFTSQSQGIGFVAKGQNEEIIGVVVGPLNPQGYFKKLLKDNWFRFCFASLGAVMRKPKAVLRLLRAVFYRGQAPDGPVRALLSSVAIDPELQNKGVGKALVKRWVQEVRDRGVYGCFLTTDADDNQKVNNFYQNLGWRIESTYDTPEGRRMHRYVYDLKN
jgi:GNAT superfamily N-acetyltransferase